MTPESFRDDLSRSKDTLEQIIGKPVLGYRAPTFSVVRRTAWALDIMAEEGLLYDSSIYPVRHDRYGIPGAPRGPFLARGRLNEILELPPATLRIFNMHLPVGGGGYFRLFPLSVMNRAITQASHECRPPVAMLYFHPWEFDPDQRRLPLSFLSGCRTYVGTNHSRERLERLVSRHRFARAGDVASQLLPRRSELPSYVVAPSSSVLAWESNGGPASGERPED
jgi:polysaccharide deacetylase family protein (PEP-CTERM system associated)